MSASNLFDDLEGDDDIFYTPAKTPPKKKKQWMDDLLDDDKDLFGDIKSDAKEPATVEAPCDEEKVGDEAKKVKSGGGLFDDLPLDGEENEPLGGSSGGQPSNVNGYKGEDFVMISHNEVPSPEEAERTANPPPATHTAQEDHDGPNSDLFNQDIGYEERARLRREQRRKRAEEKERSSKTPSPTSPPPGDTKQERSKRSTTPSPSPGIEDTAQEMPDGRKSTSPVAELHVAVEPQVEKAASSTPTPEPPPPAPQPNNDANEQIWQLTKSLERAQSENGYLKSENEQLSGQVKTLKDRVAELEKQLADRDKKEDVDSAANKKQVADLKDQLKSKDKQIEELRAALKKSESPHHGPVTTVVSLKKAPHSPAQSPRTKLRSGVDKGRPITSVADSVKKFGGASTTEVKRSTVPAKPKQSSPAHVKSDDKHTTAKKPSVTKPSPPAKPRVGAHHDKPDAHTPKHSHAHGHAHHPHPSKDHTHHPHPHHHPHSHPHKPDTSSKSVKVTHKKPHHHTHAHTAGTDKKESEKQEKKMEEEKKTEEVTISKEEPKPEPEPEPVAPPAEPEPPSEQPKSEAPPADAKPSEKREEETTIQQLEKDTTRAQRVISLFENKGSNKPEQDQAPVWKTSAQQQRAARDLEEREKEMARQKEQEQEQQQQQQQEEKEKEKAEVAEDKTRTSSNASSHKDEPVVVNGSAETTSAESANDEKETTDGGMISKAKSLAPSSSNVTKSTSALPSATKNTSNKNDEIKIRDNKIKKAGSSTTTIQDPKKRLMVEEAKGKRSSWAAPKREECAVCGKVVYVMERLEADKVVYHKTCFKCSVCNKTLSTGTYAALQGKIYCKVHFKQLFKMKGNYDEGFGREQHKTKWLKKDQLDGESEA